MTSTALRRATLAFPGLLCAWLFWAALWVDIEYYDGFETLVNSEFFLGRVSYYNVLRGPLLAVLLIPAEWLKLRLGLHPLEVRPHHLTMATLHCGYLVACLLLIRRCTRSAAAALLAFATAVTTFIFFTYAPFLSHDLLPGAMFLGLGVLAADFLERGGAGRWLGVVALGAALPLLKLLYGICFFAVVLAALLAVLPARKVHPERVGRLGLLVAGAAVGGGLTWLVLSHLGRGLWPDASLWVRPWLLIRHQSEATLTRETSAWLYLVNLPAYGLTPLLLLVPGLALAFKGEPRQRMLAICWVVAAVATQLLSHREVRYLAYLSPLSAALIAPVLERGLARRRVALALWGLCALDLALAVPEAFHVAGSFYRQSWEKEFLRPLGQPPGKRPPILMAGETLFSFRDPAPSRLIGDRYHRVFHLSFHHFLSLWGYSPREFLHVRDDRRIPEDRVPEGALLFSTHGVLHSLSRWEPADPEEHFQQTSAMAQRRAIASEGATAGVEARVLSSPPSVSLSPEGARWLEPLLLPAVSVPGDGKRYPLRRMDAGTWAIEGWRPGEDLGAKPLTLSGFRPLWTYNGVSSPMSVPGRIRYPGAAP